MCSNCIVTSVWRGLQTPWLAVYASEHYGHNRSPLKPEITSFGNDFVIGTVSESLQVSAEI
jgi:hypothetical protein